MFLRSRTILLISPQPWGKMFLSKHHYAVELARAGNEVYFLNPPETASKRQSFDIAETAEKRLYLINHSISFPYNLKFRWIGLFHFFMKAHVKSLLTAIGKPIDIIWSFDLGWLYPFNLFPEDALKIFHPVDEPLNKTAISSAKGAQILFSVTREILEKYRHYSIPSHFINHGISEQFLLTDYRRPEEKNIHVGFAGNLLRRDIDRQTFLDIVKAHPEVIFDCFGNYKAKSNIGGAEDQHTMDFIRKLQGMKNVVFHGVVPAHELPSHFRNIDVFLICYDVKEDQSKGTNYHKVMEFISTGKAIVSNNITTYQQRPDLVRMVKSREDNAELPALFDETLRNLDEYNNPGLQQTRKSYAADNTYSRQIERIAAILEQTFSKATLKQLS